MTENADELNLTGYDVAFQHQIHELEKQKKDMPKTKKKSARQTLNKSIGD